jgi:energy-coupling factor transporter ATP-binding protein EcfA2
MNDITTIINISDKVVVIGHSGSGKTTLMNHFITHSTLKPMYIIDPIGNFSPIPKWENYDYSGVVPCNKNIKGHICIKMHDSQQFEGLIYYLSSKKPEWFLIVDEIDRYIDVYPPPYHTQRYLEEGRNYGRGGMFSVRRVGFLNKSILGNAHYLILFKILNYNDLRYLMSITDIPSNLDYSSEHSFFIFDLFKSENLGEYQIKL